MTLSRHTALARGKGPERRTRLRPFSAKRAGKRQERRDVVAAVLARDGHRCQAAEKVPRVACWHPVGESLDVHEIIPRSAWSKGYLVASNTVSTCRAHHDWIGAEPDAAHVLGLHGYSWEVGR